MSVLIAGIGYIGSALAESLLRQGRQVTGIDNFFSTDRAQIQNLFARHAAPLLESSVTSPKVTAAIVREYKPDTIFWLAAQASAPYSRKAPGYTERTNLLAPRAMLDAARRNGVRRVVYASSMRVYGPSLAGKIDETTPYGHFTDLAHLSHCYVEKLMEFYAKAYSIECVAVRLAVVYGLGPVVKTDYSFMTVPNKFCLQAVRGETLVVSPTGNAPTPFIHVDDAAKAMLVAADVNFVDKYLAVNGCGEITTPGNIAGIVQGKAREMGLPVNVQGATTANVSDSWPVVSSRLEQHGFTAQSKIADHVSGMLSYFRHAGTERSQ